MIKKLAISNFRGIRSGEIDELRPFTILVGRNGQGKSTILEAAYLLAGAPSVGAFQHVATRRTWYGPATVDYLTPSDNSGKAVAQGQVIDIRGRVDRGDGNPVDLQARCEIGGARDPSLAERADKEGISPGRKIVLSLAGDRSGQEETIIGDDGKICTPTRVSGTGERGLDALTFLDMHSFSEPEGVLRGVSGATVGGWLEDALQYIQRIVSELSDLRLIEIHGRAVPMLYYGKGRPSVPFYVAGDGVRRIIELALAVLGGPPGLVLMEEPENFVHPGARIVCADILWAAVERGEQVIISTHNLDLVDELLGIEPAIPRDAEKVAVIHTTLTDGKLAARRLSGQEAKETREILGQDLRV